MSGAISMGETRKHLFRRSSEGTHAEAHEKTYTDFEDKPTPNQRAEIDELLSQLREEVTTIEETNWVYEGGETHVVKIRT